MQGSTEITNITITWMICQKLFVLTQEKFEQESKGCIAFSIWQMVSLDQSGRGQITMINDMAKKQRRCAKEDVLNKSNILELLKIEDEYELWPDYTGFLSWRLTPQDANGEYLEPSCTFALVRRESGFISGFGCRFCMIQPSRRRKSVSGDFVSNTVMSCVPLISVKSYSRSLRRGSPVWSCCSWFYQGFTDETQPYDAYGDSLLLLVSTMRLVNGYRVINFTAFITFILNRLW